jgi:drug/metabolite transporter (DMT)-like permease
MKMKMIGYLFLIGALVTSGLVPIGYKLVSQFDPIAVGFYIVLIGAIFSFLYMLLTNSYVGISKLVLDWKKVWPFVFVGAAEAVQVIIFAYTTHYVSASLLAVLYRTWPLMFVLMAPLLLRERITKYDTLAVVIGFTGVALTLSAGAQFGISSAVLPFAMLILFAAFLDAAASVFQKKYNYNIGVTIFLFNAFGLIVMGLAVLAFGTSLSLSASGVYPILILGVLQTVLVTLFFTGALRYMKSSLVANASMTIPFLTILFGATILNEPIALSYFLIVFSVILGLVVQNLAPKTSNYLVNRKAKRQLPVLYDVTAAFVNTKSTAIYNEIKDGGRVLACYKKQGESEVSSNYTNVVDDIVKKNPNCLILTNKTGTKHVQPDEFEFIQEIIGHKDDDLLLLGVGKPDSVEKAFDNLDSYFKPQISFIPPKVES